jgi:hypothetical protein
MLEIARSRKGTDRLDNIKDGSKNKKTMKQVTEGLGKRL